MQNETETISTKATIKSWVELHSDQLFSWAYHKTSDKEAAEDLVQETFLAVIHSIEKFENKSDPKTWLFSILKNKIADHYRKLYRHAENKTISFNDFFDSNESWNSDSSPQNWQIENEENLLDNQEFNKTLSHCLEKLPANLKAPILLKFVEEKDSSIICQELEITTTNYWQMIHRAKLQLRKCLEINWFKK